MAGLTSGLLMTLGSNLLIQVTVVLVVGLAVEAWVARRGAAWACLAQRATLLGVLLIPIAALVGHTVLPATWYLTLPEPASRPGQIAGAGYAYTVGAGLWFLGAAVLWARLLGGWWMGSRLLRGSRPADAALGLRVQRLAGEANQTEGAWPEVRVSERVASPLLVGVRRAVLLLPAGQEDACGDAVLLHELTHYRRRDNAWTLLMQMVRASFWVHPLVWLLDRRRRETAEFACDDTVVTRTRDPRGYADALLHFAALTPARPGLPIPAASLFGSRRALTQRVRRMLLDAPRPQSRCSRGGVVLITLMMLLGLVGSTLVAVHHTVGVAAAGYAWLWCAAS